MDVQLEDISRTKTTYAQMIQSYSEAQCDLWRQVPALALAADGRTGYSDTYARAYRCGLWMLRAESGLYVSAVDLRTGTIVDVWQKYKSASEEELMKLDVELLDAEGLVESLRTDAKRPYGSYYTKNDIAQWKARRKEYAAGIEAMMAKPVTALPEPRLHFD